MEKALPFKSKSKTKNLDNKVETEESYLKKLSLPTNKPLKSYLLNTEKDVYSLVQRLKTIQNLKQKKGLETKKKYEADLQKKEDEVIKKQKLKEREKRLKLKSHKKKED